MSIEPIAPHENSRITLLANKINEIAEAINKLTEAHAAHLRSHEITEYRNWEHQMGDDL